MVITGTVIGLGIVAGGAAGALGGAALQTTNIGKKMDDILEQARPDLMKVSEIGLKMISPIIGGGQKLLTH